LKSWSSMTDAEKIGLVAAVVVVLGDALALIALLVDSGDTTTSENTNSSNNMNTSNTNNTKGTKS